MAQVTQRKPIHWLWVFVVILLVGYGTHILIVEHGLPFIDDIDEPNFYLLANDWRGALDAYWRNDWLAGYPPGYIWLYSGTLNVIDGIFHPNVHIDMSVYVRLMRLLSVWADLLSLSLVILLGRWLAGRRAGLLAGAVWALSSAVTSLSVLALPDGFTVLWCALSAAFSVRAVKKSNWRWALLATAAALMGITFKYAVFPVLALPGLSFLWLLWRFRQRMLLPAALALLLVIGTAYGLLVVYGAAGLENAEALQFRDSFFTNFFNSTRWRYMFNGLFGTAGHVLVFMALGAALLMLLLRWRLRDGWLIGLVLAGAAGILIVVPAYLGGDPPRVYPIRYTWPGLVLLIPVCAALIVRLLSVRRLPSWVWWGALALPVLALLPGDLNEIAFYRKPHTLALAQKWFDQTAPDGSIIWTDGPDPYLSLSHYDRGFYSYKQFISFFGKEMTDWEGTLDDVNYVYLDPTGAATWPTKPGWPPLDQLTLLKHFGDSSTRGMELRIYSPTVIPDPQSVAFQDGTVRLLLWGYTVQHEGSQLTVKTFWQAPAGIPSEDYSYNLYLTPSDNPQQVVTAHDAQLGLRRTSTWDDPAERVEGGIAPVSLNNLQPGDYTVWLVVYYWETLGRLTLGNGETALALATIYVD